MIGRLEKDASRIQNMFSSIAHRYDLLNRLLSIGRDRYWRRFAVSLLPPMGNLAKGLFLDVATGTADVAIEILRRYPDGVKIVGVDFSHRMLELARGKVARMGYQDRIDLQLGDAMSLPFEDRSFDGAIIAFGIRNLPDYRAGISEMSRVVREGGRVVILEFTNPTNRWIRGMYYLYFKNILPIIGEMISGKKGAYRYLPMSVLDFPDPHTLMDMMQEAGLKDVRYYTLTFGIVTVHVGVK